MIALREERNAVNARLKKIEDGLKAVMGDSLTGEVDGVVVLEWTESPAKDEVDTKALIASLSPRTVARFMVRKPGRRTFAVAKGAQVFLALREAGLRAAK